MFITVACETKLTKLPEPAKSLHKAAADSDIDQVKSLLSRGADVNAEDEEEKTPLHYAAQTGKMEVVQLLVEAGADVNAMGKNDWPPLCIAAENNHIAVAEYLIAHGANVNPDNEWTPLQQAPYSSSVEMVEMLIAKGADINAGEGYWTALHGAADKERRDIAELLIQKGANVNAKDERGYPPLYYAIQNKNLDTTKLLIDRGADIQIKDLKGYTPLHWSPKEESKEIAELLIARGADVSIKDNSGRTALHAAAKYGRKDVAEFLIAKGADINAKDKQGHTPLYIAVCYDYKVAKLLINKGADGNIKTESGQTLFQLAQERKSIESTVPDMIFDGEPNSVFGNAIACGDVDGDGYDDVLVGAHRYDKDNGRAYLYYGGQVMDKTCDLVFESEREGDLFGIRLCCGDIDNDGYDDIIIVAYQQKEDKGWAYLYWGSERASMDANPDKIFDGEVGGIFAVYDIDNDGYRDIIFGSPRYPGDGTGRAYLYYGNTKELMDTSPDLIFDAENSGDNFGSSIGCGDLDNDGYGDILVGARHFPAGDPRQGRAYLYYGDKKSNMDSTADEIFDAESEGIHVFGQDIVCHDFNNDGYDDTVIGAQGYNDRQGRAYLFYGNTRANLNTVPDQTFDGEMEYSDYSWIILCGDIDGDNSNDIIIGADLFRQQVGRVYVYWGSELSGPSPKPGRIFTGENPHEWFSQMMACGDVNNDGYDDLVIGAKGYKAGSEQGRAYLYYGGPKN